MYNRRYTFMVFLLIVIFILPIKGIYADEIGESGAFQPNPQPDEPSLQDKVLDGLKNGDQPSQDQLDELIAEGKLSDDIVNLLDGANVRYLLPDRLSPGQQKLLSEDQLSFGIPSNFDLVSNQNNLDPEVVKSILSERSGVDVDADLGSNDHGTLTENGFEFDSIEQVDVGKTLKIRDAVGVSVNPPNISVEKANVVEFMGITNEKVDNFNGNTNKGTYNVDSANMVQAGCFNVKDVKDASFEMNGKVTMKTKNNSKSRVAYGFQNEFTVESTGTDNSLTADPRGCFNPSYEAKSVNVTIGEDVVVADNKTNISFSEHGLECIDFSPPGTYLYRSDNLASTFALEAEKEKHTVCLKRFSDQSFETKRPHYTVVDFTTKKIRTNGMLTYKRFFFNYFSNPILLVEPNLVDHHRPLTPLSCILKMDTSFLKAQSELFNSDVENNVKFNNFVSLYDKKAQRWWDVNPHKNQLTENVITTYNTVDFPPVEVVKDITISNNVQILPEDHLYFDTEFFTFK